MLLMTTIPSWVSPNHQIQTKKHHKNTKPHLLSPRIFNTIFQISSNITPKNHQTTNHNATISKFCEMGNIQNAINVIPNSEKSKLDSKTYSNILQLCAETKSLHHGKKVHNLICSSGIEFDSVLFSKLVFMYVSCGDVTQGRRVFDNMVIKFKHNVFLWNFMMNVYAKMGDYEKSICLFTKMIDMDVEPDSYTLSCVFKCLAMIGNGNVGGSVHGYVLKFGFGFDTSVVNSMIAFYFKRGNVDSAHKLFDNLSDRDVITWNSMISGYVANGLAKKGFEVFNEMICCGISVDLATMVSVVIACANMGDVDLGRAVHCYAAKGGFEKNMKFSNTLLDMYSKCGDVDAAYRVFKTMDERCIVSWSSMIAGYVRNGESDVAISLFLDMNQEGVKPDTFTVTSILHACASNGSLEKGKEVHHYIRENQMQTLAVSNALIDMYAKCGSMDDSYSVFSEMQFKDIVSWNTIIGGYSKNRLPNEALDLFIEMQREISPDNVTITCILPACASLASLNKGREIHAQILRKGLISDQYVINALIDMYVKCGCLILAKSLFDMTVYKSLVTWTVMIAGYGMYGFGQEALSTFNNMLEKGIKPNETSFTSILFACSHSGLLREGFKFYNTMVNDFNIEPKLEHYACMVDLLSRAGKLLEAFEFIETMPFKPDVTIWGALLCGCRFHHNVKLAEKVAEKIFELEPGNMEHYVLLANIYSEAEKWEEVKTLRNRRTKNREYSWVDIKGKVNIFIAGDNENPEAKKIESLLEKLRTEMEKNWLSGKQKYVLVDKKAAVCGHSESLAMCFGILKLPPGRTIRVSKNLRVCGDCHDIAKFISKNVGREVVLRDSNRFHHFKDGSCSCRGYW